jgi:DNA-binding LacI/PurR family transcriptional regulator
MRLAGLIVLHLPYDLQSYLQEETARYHIPFVMLDNTMSEAREAGIWVNGDDVAATGLAVDHLVKLGHQRIAMIGSAWGGAAQLREQGYRRAMERHGLAALEEIPSSTYYDDEATERATRELLSASPRPTAILCISDLMAMVVCRTARHMGLRVPQDLSVVGYDDIMAAARNDPPLTTLAQPFETMGRLAVKHLMQAAKGGSKKERNNPPKELVPARLVIRSSTAPPGSML